MQFRTLPLSACCLLPASGIAQSTQSVVVPATHATTDAISYLWIPGASCDVRQQTLIGPSHLTAVVGRHLTAIELRRSASNVINQGGTANLSVSLSTSPSRPLHASRTFAENVGGDATNVFSGPAAIPTSPASPGPVVSWTPNNVVRVQFQTPFRYSGGTLCVDVTGFAHPGHHAEWWMADAVFEDIAGTATTVGNGCGTFGGPARSWSFAATRKLAPGSYAEFEAIGPASSVGFAVFGTRSPWPVPLTALGLPSPNCNLHLATIDFLVPALFEPCTHPLSPWPGSAVEEFWVPDDSAVFGTTMTTQWFEWSQLATSNAIEWSIASAIPAMDMTSIEGIPGGVSGNVAVGHAHVMRFEVQ